MQNFLEIATITIITYAIYKNKDKILETYQKIKNLTQ